ncbi:unnamed protein product [Brassica napus]|uniref:(rape) hypothetical protein n=1 Tax=Brassica napus TaxID=3708 RepID=A0A816I1H6_BRANA|nr:unnamed protein product [Brassica napus]
MAENRGGGGCCPPMDLMLSEPMQLVQVIVRWNLLILPSLTLVISASSGSKT